MLTIIRVSEAATPSQHLWIQNPGQPKPGVPRVKTITFPKDHILLTCPEEEELQPGGVGWWGGGAGRGLSGPQKPARTHDVLEIFLK